MKQSFRYRVYWEDTDAGGVVYHARYLAFFERARSDWLLGLGFPQTEMRERDNRLFAVSRMDIEFLMPARLEDELEVTVDVEQFRAASVIFGQRMYHVDGRELARASVRAACLAADTFRPARMPASVQQAIKNLTTE